MSDPGKRDQRVAIYQDTSTTADGVGQHQPSWSLVATYWASIEGHGSRNLWRAQQVQSTASHLVTFIADSVTRAIDPLTYKFVWRSKTLNPIPAMQENYRDLDISFACEEQVSGD